MAVDGRATKDLIYELDQESAKFFCVGLPIGFENDSTFVFVHEEDRLEKLNEAVKHGGEPIGLVGFVKQNDYGGTFCTRLLAEYAQEEWAKSYLKKLAKGIARAMGISEALEKDGWLN